MDNREFLIKTLDTDLSLYKFYLEVILKMSIFTFGITGALVSYQQSNFNDEIMGYSLLFPALLNLGFSVICIRGIKQAKSFVKGHKARSRELKVFDGYELSTLPMVLFLFSILYTIASVAIVLLFGVWVAKVGVQF